MAERERLFATTPEGIIEGLAKIAPHVAIDVSWELDSYHSWDGDGPDPRNQGYSPYDVTVTAKTIIDGRERDGKAHLGGVYEKPGEQDQDIHGYFTQMVDEALVELHKELSGHAPKTSRKAWDPRTVSPGGLEGLLLELRNAIKFTNVSMKEIYDQEQRRRRRR